MLKGWRHRLAVLGVVVTLLVSGSAASGQEMQAGYDVIRVSNDAGGAISYALWVAWTPAIVTTPDGGAWAFFSAQELGTEGVGDRGVLYGARYNPESGVWEPARRLPGGAVQFGASAVVDQSGVVHVIYSDRAGIEATDFTRLVYSTFDGTAWTEPAAVAPSDTAGHQLSAQLAIDANGGLHAVWQDQRGATDEQRAANANIADIYVSDLIDGAWSAPVQVNPVREGTQTAIRPKLAIDGDRLVATWMVYPDTTSEGLASATSIQSSTRPLGDVSTWAAPRPLLERGEDAVVSIGGQLMDLGTDPNGGVVAIYGRTAVQVRLYLRRLDAGQEDWGQEIEISVGEQGRFPSLAVGPDGTSYVVFENGTGQQVDVGGLAVAAGATTPGRVTVVSPAETDAQGRPAVTVDQNGGVWVIYYHQVEGRYASEVRILRGAQISTEPAAPADGTPAA